MTHSQRFDRPGTFHHVLNRGLGKRTMFEGDRDIRFFLSLIAHAVRRGQIEVLAWCILTTHFHLLLRSLTGELSEVMREVQNPYVRAFNRARLRDGPLVRGRFLSKRVDGLEYRRALIRYIDDNPVRAGLAATPAEYPYGSARLYARERSPRWHDRAWVESEVMRVTGASTYDPSSYSRVFPSSPGQNVAYVVERRLAPPHGGVYGGDLLEMASAQVLDWMKRKATLADGMLPGLAVVGPATVDDMIAEVSREFGRLSVRPKRQERDGWLLLRAALLRDLCSATWTEIGARIGRSTTHAISMYRVHAQLVLDDVAYAELAASTAIRCRDRFSTTGPLVRPTPPDASLTDGRVVENLSRHRIEVDGRGR